MKFSRHAVSSCCARVSQGQSRQERELQEASYSSDLLRPKLQAREILFSQATWFLSDYKSCNTDACLNTSHACNMKDRSSSILSASWGTKGNKGCSERQALPFTHVPYSLPPHHLLSGKKKIFFKGEVEERQIVNASTFSPTPAKYRKMQWERNKPRPNPSF